MPTYFETADLALAATILATTGTQPTSVDGHPDQVRYLFDDTPETQAIAQAYGAGNVRVDPIVFCLAHRYLRDRATEAAGPDEDAPKGVVR
jgi:hypothetical protein